LKRDVEISNLSNELALSKQAGAKHMGPHMPTFTLPFYLRKEQLSFLTERFPRTTFRMGDDRSHDHPLAHTETMIAQGKALRLVPAGHLIIDLFSSMKLVDQLNSSQARSNNPKRMIGWNSVMTEKDCLRRLGWGPLTYPDGTLRRLEDAPKTRVLDAFPIVNGELVGFPDQDTSKLTWYCGHTFYYLSDEEVCTLLSLEGSRMVITVHRHPNQKGEMFLGECTYAKKNSVVQQLNTLTNEGYEHRDISFLWDSTTKVRRTAVGAYTWTFHMVSVDTWNLVLTGCDPALNERFPARARAVGAAAAAHEMNEHADAPTPFVHPALASLPAASCKMVGGVPIVSFNGSGMPPVKLTCPALFDFLCVSVAGKPRDTERLRDLFALARSHIANGSEFPGKRNFAVEPSLVADHVMLAFVSGLGRELEVLRALEGYRIGVREHSALLDGAAVVVGAGRPETAARSAFAVLRRVNTARKRGDVVDGFLDAFSEG